MPPLAPVATAHISAPRADAAPSLRFEPTSELEPTDPLDALMGERPNALEAEAGREPAEPLPEPEPEPEFEAETNVEKEPVLGVAATERPELKFTGEAEEEIEPALVDAAEGVEEAEPGRGPTEPEPESERPGPEFEAEADAEIEPVIGVAAEGVVKLDAELARRAAAASAASLRLSNCAFSGGGT